MIRDDIILMADASGLSHYGMGKDRDKFLHYLEAFAALVAAAERESNQELLDLLKRANSGTGSHTVMWQSEARAAIAKGEAKLKEKNT